MDNEGMQRVEPEIVSSGKMVEAQVRGEIDIQIATAKAYPRVVSQVTKKILDLATISQDTAESCWYALPRDGKLIEGPSIRMAEIVAASWGNLRVQARVVGDDGKMLTCQAACIDLETNFAAQVEVKRRVTNKRGKRYSDDMIVTTANAGCSVAFRNAIFKVVPGALLKDVMGKVKHVAMGDERTLQSKRDAAFAFFAQQGVAKERILAVIEKEDIKDVTLEDVSILRGLATAIKEGTTTMEEAFPQEPTTSAKAQKLTEELKNRRAPKKPEAPEPTEEELAQAEERKAEQKAKLEESENAKTEQAPVDDEKKSEEYQYLSRAYEKHATEIDKILAGFGLPNLPEIQEHELDEVERNKVKRAKSKLVAMISK